MRMSLAAFGAMLTLNGAAFARTDANPAMNSPDMVAWQTFIHVNTGAGGTNALFETWASDTDTFKMDPRFPTSPQPLALRPPIIATVGPQAIQESGGLLPAIPPDPTLTLEETRRNEAAFKFIKDNGLFKVTGLKAAFGKTLSFPVDSIEVKANWMPVEQVPAFTGNKVALADVPRVFHVNTSPKDNKKYALMSMHVITKLVPNWTWATFEHKFNPKRCDILGCRDAFGAAQSPVPPNKDPGLGYPDCVKTPALKQLTTAAHWDAAFENYCLKGSQTDFTDNNGLDIRLGNSITEDGFVIRSSCITCHGRAAFDQNGNETSQAGFGANGAPLGPIQPNWYWSFTARPPIFEGMPGLKRIATSVDFVWSIAFCAVDDTVNPPKLKDSCVGK
jgi:hypothetical protein